MRRRLFAAICAAPLLAVARPTLAAPSAAPVTWAIDRGHSEVSFRIRHLLTKVRGTFGDFHGTITADPDAWQDASIDVEIRSASISTENAKRDAHLRSSDFFAADSFPTISFRSTRIERRGGDAKIYGMLTMRGITRPVVLDARFGGVTRAANEERVAVTATTTLDRLAWGVKWNRAAEGGGAVLDDDVEVEIAVEAVRATR